LHSALLSTNKKLKRESIRELGLCQANLKLWVRFSQSRKIFNAKTAKKAKHANFHELIKENQRNPRQKFWDFQKTDTHPQIACMAFAKLAKP
jgi:hypothetical protein